MSALALCVLLAGVEPQSTLREFEARLQIYVELHQMLEVHTLPRTLTPTFEEVLAASEALAAAIMAARPDARQGDIFTPPVTRLFRERIHLAFGRLDVDRFLADFHEDDNFRELRASVHARDRYGRVPNGMPPPLLWMLPELPPELEYRIVGRDLALWDEHAAMIVDFIPNAFPPQSFA
jgi:hypothetical protein